MPELPEVETIAAGLRSRIAGRRIAAVRLSLPKLLRATPPAELGALAGAAVAAVRRRGKILIVECGDRALLFHLKMTGGFLWVDGGSPVDRHTHLIVSFEGSAKELRFQDVRKFGFLRCLPKGEVEGCAEIRTLGPEPLDIRRPDFEARLAERRGRLKSLLLNQKFLAGIGNIYADEMLFGARLHPRTQAERLRSGDRRRLWISMRAVLRGAVAAGGSTIHNYRGVGGEIGGFQTRHRVYGRAGAPCFRCGVPIRRIVVGGRSTFFCPACQQPRF